MLTIGRRILLQGAAAAALSTMVRPGLGWAQDDGPFKLPPLPYDFGALEPSIDAKTMELHHDKHHAAYVKKLNEAVKDHGKVAVMPIEEILAKLPELPEDIRTVVRNNGGGHANHSMFWQVMGPGDAGHGGAPAGNLKAAIDSDLGGLDKLKEDFNDKGGKVFGSGWVFVAVTPEGKLSLVSKPNQDTPLMEGGRVLFGNDVWEHAYYLRYQNRRPEYLKAWWDIVNWKAVGERYAAAKAGALKV